MCGIAGIMTADGSPPGEPTLDRLADALAHRGPDGRGRHMAGGVGMVQTRLAIIDLETGDQPFYLPDGAAL
ncbi:MAG: asparagine synthetase B, partial [Kiloniellaceae bacterium]